MCCLPVSKYMYLVHVPLMSGNTVSAFPRTKLHEQISGQAKPHATANIFSFFNVLT
jgi:hypothetical protein